MLCTQIEFDTEYWYLKYSFNITVNLLDVSNTKRFEGRIDVLNVYDSYNSNMQARVRDGSSFIFYWLLAARSLRDKCRNKYNLLLLLSEYEI